MLMINEKQEAVHANFCMVVMILFLQNISLKVTVPFQITDSGKKDVPFSNLHMRVCV